MILKGLLKNPERKFVCVGDAYMRTWTPPWNASGFLEGSAQSGPAQSYIRPLRCGASCWPRARMEMRGSGPNRPGELGGSLVAYNWLPRPRLDDRLPLPFLRPAHIPPDSIRAPLRRGAPVPCRTPCSAAAPTRCAPSCWPAPPRRAYEACAPASGPATNPAARRAERPGESPTSRT